MKAGIAASSGEYVLISMSDGSDEPHVVDSMVELAFSGADVVAASRYMPGGRQLGGPPLKRLLSRVAGLTLHWFAGVRTHDPTNNFKLYSRRFLDTVTIESTAGFELARTHGQGNLGRPPRGRGPHDVARSHCGAEQFQTPAVAAALPSLVPDRVRGSLASPQSQSLGPTVPV
ncbi:MAG: glycosyltransferase family 2 protein [Chloroflexi bacterium]|nr:glycosyltransferase family 2 protein [Chloroflexota bacterium]